MRTLVIGATGFVGRSLVRCLTKAGHDVAGLARSEAAVKHLSERGLTAVKGDVLQPETIGPSLARFDNIVFMPRVDIARELVSVKALLASIEGTGKRFIFTSGTGVLVENTDGEWREQSYAEDDPFTRSPLAGARVDTEDLVRASSRRGIHAMTIRPPLIWGYGWQRALSALHGSARSGAVCYLGRGLNVMSSIHVDDLAEIYRLALDKGVSGALYHAVSGEASWRALAAEVARLRDLPLRSVDLAEARNLFGDVIARIVFSVTSRTRCPRTRQELGWTPSPDRLDIFAELAHPAFMSTTAGNSDLDSYFSAHR